MVSLLRRLAPWAMALPFLLVPQAAAARPFTTDDLLALESYGAVSLSPQEDWIVFERRGPYDSAARFDLTYLGAQARNRLWRVRPDGTGLQPLLAPEEGVGHGVGAWSPSGRRLLIHRLQGDRWDSGVVEVASGRVRWLGVGAEPPIRGQTAVWLSEDALVLAARADGALPYDLSGLAPGLEAMTARWAASRDGGTAVSVWGGGARAEADGFAARTDLVRIDLRTGRRSRLDQGRALDLSLSPDRRWLAVVDRGRPYPVRPDRPFHPMEQAEARTLTLYDLSREADATPPWRPCGACDVAQGLLAWSPDSQSLLVWVRREATAPDAGAVTVVRPESRAFATLDTSGLVAEVGASAEASFQTVRADWLGGRPILLARPEAGGRPDWYALTAGTPVNLTRAFDVAPSRLDALAGESLLVVADGQAWAIDLDGARTPLSTLTGVRALALERFVSPRQRWNDAPRRDWLQVSTPDGAVETVSVRTQSGDASPASSSSRFQDQPGAAWLASTPNLALSRRTENGVESLVSHRPGAAPLALDRINTGLSGVTFARPVPVAHPGPSGEPLTSWLYPPPGADRPAGRGRVPLIIVAYPGGPGRPQANPAEFNAMANIQLLAAMGYAVLVPTLPRRPAADPAEGLTPQVVSVLDATLQAHPELDRDRVGYLGHSFGGYAGLILATQTDRIASYAILSAPSDLTGAWGGFAGFGRSDQAFGITTRRNAGWGEQAQGAVGGPPWAQTAAYVRASPIHAADRITAPVLLVHGELDFFPVGQAELMFSALWRQNKEVELAIYWGEAHLFSSPGNIRDLHARLSRWFEQTLGRPSTAGPAAGLPTDGPKPPGTPPRESPAPRLANAVHPPPAAPRTSADPARPPPPAVRPEDRS